MDLRITAEQLKDCGVSDALADHLYEKINDVFAEYDQEDCWYVLTREILTPAVSFEVHLFVFRLLEAHWNPQWGAMPAWTPSLALQRSSNIASVMDALELNSFDQFYKLSVTDHETFWSVMVQRTGIVFRTDYKKILETPEGPTKPRWLTGARLNIADSCFSADPEATAVVLQRVGQINLERVSYGELEQLVNRVANGLVQAGFIQGESIAIDMTMTLESVAIYLGIVRAGCAVISIADSFSPTEIATRLRIGKASGIFTTDYIQRGTKKLPMYTKVTDAEAPRAIVLPCGDALEIELREGDLAWDEFLSEKTDFDSVGRDPGDASNILFSSGTTGDPKAIPWNQTTPIKAAADGYLHQDIQTADVVCWPTNLGWMMGPWLVYASLINGATMALFYDAPNTSDFCRFVQDAKVTVLGVVPSLVKAWRTNGAVEHLDWSGIKLFSSTGECSNATDMLFLMAQAGYKPVIEYCGGTEIGGGYLTGTVVQSAAPATFTTPALGLGMKILDEEEQEADAGEVFLVPPSIGLSLELLNKDHDQVYYEGSPRQESGFPLRRHGDQIERLPGGFYRALGRADDTMNLGGIKISSAEIERVFKEVDGIDETAAVAVPPPGGGPSQLVVFAVLSRQRPSEVLEKELRTALRTKLNPLFKIHGVVVRETLPRTASGKVMRRVLRQNYLENEATEEPD